MTDWKRLYRDSVGHHMPKVQPYAKMLETLVLAERGVLAPWSLHAAAMLKGFGQSDAEDLAMLGRMMERGSMLLLPAKAIADLVKAAIAACPTPLAIRCATFDGLARIDRADADAMRSLVLTITRRTVRDVMAATDMLCLAASNACAMPGSRVDMTGSDRRSMTCRIGDMAFAIAMDFVSEADITAMADSIRTATACHSQVA